MKLFTRFLTSRRGELTGAVIPHEGFHIFVSCDGPKGAIHNFASYIRWVNKSRKALALARKLNKVTSEILTEHEFGWLREVAGATTETGRNTEQQERGGPRDGPATPLA